MKLLYKSNVHKKGTVLCILTFLFSNALVRMFNLVFQASLFYLNDSPESQGSTSWVQAKVIFYFLKLQKKRNFLFEVRPSVTGSEITELQATFFFFVNIYFYSKGLSFHFKVKIIAGVVCRVCNVHFLGEPEVSVAFLFKSQIMLQLFFEVDNKKG